MTQKRFVTRQAVFVVLRNEKGEILLQQRANTGYLDGYWDFSASGHVERGESIHDAALRELKEEIGISARRQDLKLVHIDQYFMSANYINWTFVLDAWQGTPTIGEPEKVSELRYFSIGNPPEKCVNVLRVSIKSGLDIPLTFSVTNQENWLQLMGEPFA